MKTMQLFMSPTTHRSPAVEVRRDLAPDLDRRGGRSGIRRRRGPSGLSASRECLRGFELAAARSAAGRCPLAVSGQAGDPDHVGGRRPPEGAGPHVRRARDGPAGNRLRLTSRPDATGRDRPDGGRGPRGPARRGHDGLFRGARAERPAAGSAAEDGARRAGHEAGHGQRRREGRGARAAGGTIAIMVETDDGLAPARQRAGAPDARARSRGGAAARRGSRRRARGPPRSSAPRRSAWRGDRAARVSAAPAASEAALRGAARTARPPLPRRATSASSARQRRRPRQASRARAGLKRRSRYGISSWRTRLRVIAQIGVASDPRARRATVRARDTSSTSSPRSGRACGRSRSPVRARIAAQAQPAGAAQQAQQHGLRPGRRGCARTRLQDAPTSSPDTRGGTRGARGARPARSRRARRAARAAHVRASDAQESRPGRSQSASAEGRIGRRVGAAARGRGAPRPRRKPPRGRELGQRVRAAPRNRHHRRDRALHLARGRRPKVRREPGARASRTRSLHGRRTPPGRGNGGGAGT